MSQAVDTAPRANGRRGTGALLPCAERSAGFAKLSLSHARRAVNNRRTACTRHRRGQCVALTGVSIEWAVRPVPFRAGVGSLHPHQHALPTAARRPRSRHVRLVRARVARRARRARVRDGIPFRVGRTALSPVDDPALNDLLLAWYYRWGRRRAPRARRSRSRGARCVMPRRPPRSGYYTGRYHALQEARRS